MSYTESTMKEIIERFIKHQEYRSRNRSTAKHYMSDLRIFLHHIGDKPIEQITVQDIDGFVSAQSQQGLKATTINRRLATLHAFFAYWADEASDELRPSPVKWRRHKIKQSHPLPRDASDTAVDRLFAIVTDPRDRAMFGLMVGAGLRVGEVISLQVNDVEAPADPNEIAQLRVCGKGEKERIVLLTARWRHLLATWLKVRPAAESAFLFLNQHQRPLTVAGVQFRLRHYCQQAGLQLTCHQLRHTFARRLTEQEMPIESISQLLGHAQITTTQRYTNGANPDLRRQLLAALENDPVALSQPSLVEATTASESGLTQPTPRPVPGTASSPEVADRAQLRAALDRFNLLPDWLRPYLVDYLSTRWRHWQAHLAPTHAHRLARQLTRIWQALLGQANLSGWSDLRRSHLETWLQTRAEAGIALSSQRNELSDLLSFLTFVTEQNIPLPATLFQIKYPPRPQPLPRHLAPEAYRRLWQVAIVQTQDQPMLRALFITLCHTGVRLSELLNMRLTDLDLAGGRLLIRGSKNGYDRMVYLTTTLTAALSVHIKERPVSALDHLWLDHAERPYQDHQVRYCLRQWGQLAAVPVSPHVLRHTFATRLVNQGVSLAAIKQLLGHRTLNMTQHYARLYDHTVKEQFAAAMAHIEGIATSDWPIVTAVSTNFEITVSDLTDSV
jgi:site-specific recombinase XerD